MYAGNMLNSYFIPQSLLKIRWHHMSKRSTRFSINTNTEYRTYKWLQNSFALCPMRRRGLSSEKWRQLSNIMLPTLQVIMYPFPQVVSKHWWAWFHSPRHHRQQKRFLLLLAYFTAWLIGVISLWFGFTNSRLWLSASPHVRHKADSGLDPCLDIWCRFIELGVVNFRTPCP